MITLRSIRSLVVSRHIVNVNGSIRCLTHFTSNPESNKNDKRTSKCLLIAAGLTAWIAYKIRSNNNVNAALLQSSTNNDETGNCVSSLPFYTLDQISEHNSLEKGVWVTYKQGVYDITKFISEHPGGDQILLAAGSSVEPFWLLYAVHKNPHVLTLLEKMRIGNLSLEDSKEATKNMSDPYANDPKRHNVLKPATVKPFNAEPPPSLLVQSFVTPNEIFYVRNHLPVPEIDPTTYQLEVEVEGQKDVLYLSLDDLKKMPKRTITATIMCAGNRRSEMIDVKPVKGLSWGPAAVSNATWTGVKLKDILKLMGITSDTTGFNHVQFEGLDTDPTNTPYGASILFTKAISDTGDVLIAYEMNGEPIPRDHGFPIRAIVPGVVGARNVKWLGRIVVSKYESDSHWQQNDYKGFSPSTDWDTVDFGKAPAIQELPVISAICRPISGQTVVVENNEIIVQGYAWSGGGQKIIRIDVTIDGGDTWIVANIDHQDESLPPRHWSWCLWTAKVPVKNNVKKVEIWAKAVDSSYNTQPESFKNIWNLRGVLGNAYHRVPINLRWQ